MPLVRGWCKEIRNEHHPLFASFVVVLLSGRKLNFSEKNSDLSWSKELLGGIAMRSKLRTHPWPSWIGFTLSLGVPLLTACGSLLTSLPPFSSSSVTVAITPSAATIPQGGSISYSATVKGVANTAVKWSIQEGSVGGSITSSGVYTAPNAAVGTFHVVATSVADPTVSAEAAVGVEPSPGTTTAAGIFTAVGNMTTPRVGHTATLLGNGKVLITGGSTDGVQPIASAELYDPSTRTFAPTGSMITPRQYHSATPMVDGRVLIAGGISGTTFVDGVTSVIPIFTAEIYDPSTGAFTATSDLITTAGSVWAFSPGDLSTLLPDGRVLVAAANNAEIYDPLSGTFTLTGPFADQTTNGPDTVTSLTNGKVLVTLGGCNCGVEVAELFDPQSGTFSKAGAMTARYIPDFGYTAALLTDGRVFLMGSDDYYTDVEVYDPDAGTFTSVGGSFNSQELAPASRLTDGTVLIAGGELPGGNGSTSSELYVPASGTLEYAGQMTRGRHSHKSTALPDDTVLLTGGYTFWSYPDLQPVSTAELYKP